MTFVLFNPKAHSGTGEEQAKAFAATLSGDVTFKSVLEITDAKAFLAPLSPDDTIILCGGDGTLIRMVWLLDGMDVPQKLYFTSSGTGNDFLRDVADRMENGMVRINDYIKDLPTVTVKGKTYRFINGVGFGIDGYCCEVGDALHEKSGKPVNYSAIAIKGILGKFKPLNVAITVDGVTKQYKNAWLAPTMNGRYYGGGLMIAPDQDRLNPDGKVTVCTMWSRNRIKTLLVFAGVSKGQHVKHTEMFEARAGHDITVKFDRPCALQIDGETILGVTEYTVHAAPRAAAVREEAVPAGAKA